MDSIIKSHKPNVYFVLSVDTEEEWDWQTEFPQHNLSVENIQALTGFQQFCNEIGIKPTYFVDYPVAENPVSAEILNKIAQEGNCEIGAHLHPWCNPPIQKENGEFESHVVNLPIDLVEQKFKRLLSKLEFVFNTQIKSFRTGRWGINSEILTLLVKYNIKVDSSVYPYYQNDFFSCEGSPMEPYWPNMKNPLQKGGQKDIFELPVSVGFNNHYFEQSNLIYQWLMKKPLSILHLSGMAWRLNLLRKLYLSPELTSAENMNYLISALLKRKSPIIHMNLHSSSLIDFPYRNNPYNQEQIFSNIINSINYLKQHANVTFLTISEAATRLKQHA